MSIDACLHSVFGASKVAADVMVQEYGRYFDMKTACFRGGTLTGDTATHAVATTKNATPTRLAALMTESAQLERLIAAANDDGASSGSTAALGLQMEDSLQHLDASLNSGALTDQQQFALWQQRVNLLRQIASLETSRRYYAAEGRNLDVALVSTY